MLDIAVSYDESWHHRGHSFHNGLGVDIDLLTGLPIDFQVLSNFCHHCCKLLTKLTQSMPNGPPTMLTM